MMEAQRIPAIDAEVVSRMIGAYLTGDDRVERACNAASDLLENEVEEGVQLVGEDDLHPTAMMVEGVQFGVRAAVATLQHPPYEAMEIIRELCAGLKADLRGRIDRANADRATDGRKPVAA